jgi:hypothetical protein
MNAATPPSRTVIVLALLGAAILGALFAATYVLSLGNPTPHGVPIAIAGEGPAADRATALLGGSDAFDPIQVPSAEDALSAIDDRKAYAALIPAEGRLIVSQASGFAMYGLISTALPAAAEAAGQTLSVETVNPLPEDDPRGAVMSFFVLALVVGGYIGATVLTALAGAAPASLRGGERRIVALALYAIVAGSLTTLVVGVALGHFGGHRLALTGLAIFVVFAVAAFAAALQIAIGILGSVFAMTVLVWLGSQSSSGAASWELLPVVTRSVGPYLPAGAGVDAARGILFFGGASITRSLLVLTGYAVAGTLVVLLVGRRRGRMLPGEAELAAAAGTA